ncbi:hypothetical protein [Flavobacterium sp. TBRC 19031]|uniref:hypothetical protein n=1 Tax=Flavobacterium mekongense TaxID=3379707 RepID=UPI00399B5213
MVRIVNYSKRQTEEGKEFFVLEISGGLEMVKSQITNQFYATSKRAFIPSTFDELTCKSLIGTEMEGFVVKQVCEPYDYTVKETGEVIRLAHKYVYELNQDATTNEDKAIQTLLAEGNTFSKNGQYKEEPVL